MILMLFGQKRNQGYLNPMLSYWDWCWKILIFLMLSILTELSMKYTLLHYFCPARSTYYFLGIFDLSIHSTNQKKRFGRWKRSPTLNGRAVFTVFEREEGLVKVRFMRGITSSRIMERPQCRKARKNSVGESIKINSKTRGNDRVRENRPRTKTHQINPNESPNRTRR